MELFLFLFYDGVGGGLLDRERKREREKVYLFN